MTGVTLRIAPATLAHVQWHLQNRQPRLAARSARKFAISANESDLKALVMLLADAVETLKVPKPRHRPTLDEQRREQEDNGALVLPDFKLADAKTKLKLMLIAADLADDKRSDRVGPKTLAEMMVLQGIGFEDEPCLPLDESIEWRAAKLAEPTLAAELRAYFRPIAAGLLKAEKLDTVIRGVFRAEFRRRIARAYKVKESALKGVTVKTSK